MTQEGPNSRANTWMGGHGYIKNPKLVRFALRSLFFLSPLRLRPPTLPLPLITIKFIIIYYFYAGDDDDDFEDDDDND